MPENNAEELIAAVSPRSQGGVSLFETTQPITAENVGAFTSDASVIAGAVDELKRLGFRVLQVSETTISVAGSRKLFQDVFGVRLRREKATMMEGQEVDFFSVGAEPAQQVLQPPESLSNLIEGAALSIPPVFYESALPPIAPPDPAAYRYLFVPDEVALILNATRIHRTGTTGLGVKVAMPDSGFYRHPFYFRHGYRVGPTVLGPGASDPATDAIGHGTGEAANIFATAPDAQLVPVKMVDPVGAFNAAVAENPQVITCSWGLTSPVDTPPCPAALPPYAATLAAAIATAVANNIVVCFSGGNGTTPRTPAGHPDIISVGGVHVNYPGLDLEASSYASSFDSCFFAPRHVPDVCGLVGRNVSGTAPLIMLPVQPGSGLDLPNTGANNDGWGIFSGTSAASPQVAGVVALLRQKDPTLTPADVKKILMDSATDVTVGQSAMGQPAGVGPDAATGAGLVNAKLAWIIAMGSMASQFFAAPPEVQAAMFANGQMPRVSMEYIADVLQTLRGR
jgi:serine protease AprX